MYFKFMGWQRKNRVLIIPAVEEDMKEGRELVNPKRRRQEGEKKQKRRMEIRKHSKN